MVTQYPYMLKKYVIPQSQKDGKGNWIASEGEWVEIGQCRDEHNSRASTITGTDGKAYQYLAVIYVPKDTEPFEIGEEVMVLDGDTVRQKGSVMGYRQGQLNARIWL